MLIGVALATVVVAGAHPVFVTAAAVAALQPGWFLAAMALWSLLGALRRGTSGVAGAEAAFLHGVAVELRAGAGLRGALEAAAGRAPELPLGSVVRQAVTGRPLPEVAAELAAALPGNGRLAAAALRTAGLTGGRVADVFDGLALMALEEAELARERRVATAQARLSATIVAGLPVLFLGVLAATGRMELLSGAGAAGLALLTAGLALLAAGVVAIWLMIRRAER